MNDRRRINGPAGGTTAPVYALLPHDLATSEPILRVRKSNQLRKIFLQTGLTPSASGSAYLELEKPPTGSASSSTFLQPSSLKLSCTVHGPRPLSRSAPFSPHLSLGAHVKLTPFAFGQRRGYIRDVDERDLSLHLESALKGIVIGDRWPKSCIDVTVTVLEADGDANPIREAFSAHHHHTSGMQGCALLNILAGCMTVASAAIIEAGIDCVDIVAGGVAALVDNAHTNNAQQSLGIQNNMAGNLQIVLDPCPSEHDRIVAACLVGYMASRDEIVDLWIKGDAVEDAESLIDHAVTAAAGVRSVVTEVLRENARSSASMREQPSPVQRVGSKAAPQDVRMDG